MTIRDQLVAKTRKVLLFASLFWLAFVATMLFTRATAQVFLAFGALLALAAGVLAVSLTLKCPKCGAKLGALMGHFGPLAFMAKDKVKYCPFCGADFNASVEP